MKICFVIKPYIIDPLGIAYLSSYLKYAGHKVELFLADETLKESVLNYDPDIVGYSVTTGDHVYYRNLNLEIRSWLSHKILSVFGGAHPTFYPEFSLEPGVDVCVRGEGFEAMVDIADSISNGKLDASIPNIVINAQANPLRPLLNKDTLLEPDRELIYQFPKNYHNPIKNIMCSFGCIFSCSYCYNAQLKKMYGGMKVQRRSVDSVIAEVKTLQKYPLELIFFQDDIFPMYNAQWLAEFCVKYNMGIPFHIQTRVEFISDAAIKKLKTIGLHGVTFAIEAGNEEIRKNILKRSMTNEQILDAAEILHKYDVRFRTENMIGYPYETWDTVKETLELNIKCNPEIAWASLYQPYPGTELGDLCIKNELFTGNFNKLDSTFFKSYQLDVPDKKKFIRIQKLFSLIVAYPFLMKFIDLISVLPFDYLYYKLYKAFKNYLYSHKLYRIK